MRPLSLAYVQALFGDPPQDDSSAEFGDREQDTIDRGCTGGAEREYPGADATLVRFFEVFEDERKELQAAIVSDARWQEEERRVAECLVGRGRPEPLPSAVRDSFVLRTRELAAELRSADDRPGDPPRAHWVARLDELQRAEIGAALDVWACQDEWLVGSPAFSAVRAEYEAGFVEQHADRLGLLLAES